MLPYQVRRNRSHRNLGRARSHHAEWQNAATSFTHTIAFAQLLSDFFGLFGNRDGWYYLHRNGAGTISQHGNRSLSLTRRALHIFHNVTQQVSVHKHTMLLGSQTVDLYPDKGQLEWSLRVCTTFMLPEVYLLRPVWLFLLCSASSMYKCTFLQKIIVFLRPTSILLSPHVSICITRFTPVAHTRQLYARDRLRAGFARSFCSYRSIFLFPLAGGECR